MTASIFSDKLLLYVGVCAFVFQTQCIAPQQTALLCGQGLLSDLGGQTAPAACFTAIAASNVQEPNLPHLRGVLVLDTILPETAHK